MEAGPHGSHQVDKHHATHDLFFSLDGIDGTGKSTQLELFRQWLVQQGHNVVMCRDPGSTPLGEALRQIVLHGTMAISARGEVLMYMAARAQLVDEIIAPALQEGKTVVSDRYLLASVAYQAYGLGLEPGEIWALGEFATRSLHPTMTFLLDIPVELAAQRLSVDQDRLEQRDLAYHERVRQGFLRKARLAPDRMMVIDASRSIAEIQREICRIATAIMEARAK